MIYVFSSTIITNFTIANNSAIGYWGGILGGNDLTLSNCILWNNSDWGINQTETAQINAVEPIINYSCVQGWTNTLGGLGNIDENPEFADAENGDYHLKSKAGRWNPIDEIWEPDDIDSPCIDTGDPNSPVGDEPEPNGGVINMGAYGGTAEASMSTNNGNWCYL